MSKVYVDKYKTLTASEITSEAEAHRQIRRNRRSLLRMREDPNPSRRVLDAIKYSELAIQELSVRIDQININL